MENLAGNYSSSNLVESHKIINSYVVSFVLLGTIITLIMFIRVVIHFTYFQWREDESYKPVWDQKNLLVEKIVVRDVIYDVEKDIGCQISDDWIIGANDRILTINKRDIVDNYQNDEDESAPIERGISFP